MHVEKFRGIQTKKGLQDRLKWAFVVHKLNKTKR